MQYTYKDKKSLYGDSKLAKIVKFDEVTQEVNTINLMMNLYQKRRREKNRRKIPRVIRPMQTHQRIDSFMALTT